MSMSLCRMTTRPDSAAKARMRSRAGLVRLAVSPEILAETNSLWMLNSPMPVKIDAVHVRRVEAGDHRIEARLRVLRQGPVDAGDVGIGEGVVVERGVGVQVVGRREVGRVRVRPLLLQGNAEQRRPPHACPHDLEELRYRDPLLDVVGEVEV
jgi:hypothetical protein